MSSLETAVPPRFSSSARSSSPAGRAARLPRPGRLVVRLVLAVVVTVACALAPNVVMMVPGVGGLLDGGYAGRGTTGMIVALTTMAAVMALSTLAAWLLTRLLTTRLDRAPVASLALRLDRTALAWLSGTVVVAFLVMAATGPLSRLAGASGVEAGLTQGTWWAAVAVQLIQGFLLQGIPEELVWRGWLFSSLGSGRAAAALSVVVFTVLHLVSEGGQDGWGERVLYLAMPLGFACAAMAARWVSGSVWAAVGVHGGFHLSMLVAHPSGTNTEDWRTWLVIGALWGAVGVVIALAGRVRRSTLGGGSAVVPLP